MTSLQKLEAVKENYARFIDAEQTLLEWKARAERTTRPVRESIHSGHAKNWREDAVILLAEAKDELADVLNEYIDSWQVAHTVLDAVEDPDCYEVLFRRYIQNYSWKQIAVEMKCSQRNVLLLYKKAVRDLEENEAVTDK